MVIKLFLKKVLDIPLLIPSNEIDMDIYILIKDHFKLIKIDWNEKCESCGKNGLDSKIIKFNMINNTIIVSIQRFGKILNSKNNSPIL